MTSKSRNVPSRVTQEEIAHFGLFVLFQLLGETRVALGIDDEVSEVFDRAMTVSGDFAAIGGSLRNVGAPFAAGGAAKEFRRQLGAAEPVIARISALRPFTPRAP